MSIADNKKKYMRWMLIGIGSLLLIIFALHTFRKIMIHRYVSEFQKQAVVISTTKSVEKTWNPTLKAVGTLAAINGVDVSPEVAGQVRAINFVSGEMVNAGQSLVQLDDEIDQQTLNTNNAQLNLDTINYQRQLKLLKTQSSAQQDVDQAKAKMLQSQAAAATAQVQIDKKNIKAPFAGKIGISQINLGQYVTPGQVLVPLEAMDPLYIDFSLPEQNLRSLVVGQKVKVEIDAFPKEVFWGAIAAINSKVDVNTRTISVRATISNHDLKLYPGIFANVDVILPQQQKVVTIPQTAIAYSLYGDSVYVVVDINKDKAHEDKSNPPMLIAKQQFVTLGDRQGNEVAVLKGLQPGQDVVASGQLKLQPNIPVKVDNSVNITQ